MKKAKNDIKNSSVIRWKILIPAIVIIVAVFFAIFGLIGLLPDTGDGFTKTKDPQRINLLLAGLDPDGLRTDFLAIVSYDTATKDVSVLSIPENTRMYIGGRYQKISAAHALTSDGKKNEIYGTVEALSRLTAIPLNYYIEFSLVSFIEFVDASGGVEFDIPKRMKYRDKLQDLKIDLKVGYQLLDGEECSHLVRYASYDDGTNLRIGTQQEFMLAFAEQKLTPEFIAKLPGLFGKLNIKSNLTSEDVIKYSNMLLKLKSDSITFHTLPGKAEERSGIEYWIADLDEAKTIIENEFGVIPKKLTTDKN